MDFHSIPKQVLPPKEPAMSWEKAQAMTQEVNDLASKCVIRPVAPHSPGFYSPVFLVPKSDGSWHPVINLKELNRHVVHHHFKMEGIRMLQGLIQEGDWLVKLDLKDAYLTVPIASNHRKFLRFWWDRQPWEFSSLPFGLSSALYVFTKLLKPVVGTLRQLGIRIIVYLDDMLLMAQSKEMLKQHLATVLHTLIGLGFIINTSKSVFTPTQELEFLGFLLNTLLMTISLPWKKVIGLKQTGLKLLKH